MIFINARRRSCSTQIKGSELLIAKLSRLNLFLALILACTALALGQNPSNISPPSATDHIQWKDRDPDFLVTNAAGTVHALDSARGITLWTAHYASTATSAPSQPRRFVPVVANLGDNTTLVIAPFEKVCELSMV